MESINKPSGLIRYASENSIAKGEPLRYTTRMKLYTGLCFLLLSILSVILLTRKDIDVTVIRTAGMLYQERGADSLSNLYNIKLINKTTKDLSIEILLQDKTGRIQMAGKPTIQIRKEGQAAGTFFIVLPRSVIKQRKTVVKLLLYSNGEKLLTANTSFLGPAL